MRRRAAIPATVLSAVLAIAFGLVGCGQVPQPFAKDDPDLRLAPFLIAPTTEGVMVLPVEGVDLETGTLIAELTAAALQRQEIAASVHTSNGASLFLAGAGRRLADGAMELSWTLARADGTVIGERTDAVASDEQLARSTAAVAGWIRPHTAPPPVNAAVTPKVTVRGVDGASGDGNQLLRRAIGLALERAPVELTPDLVEDGHVLRGEVAVDRLANGQDRVVISWILEDAAGREIGTVDQANSVPGGSLDENWGAVAAPIAEAAIGGVVALLRESETLRTAARIH